MVVALIIGLHPHCWCYIYKRARGGAGGAFFLWIITALLGEQAVPEKDSSTHGPRRANCEGARLCRDALILIERGAARLIIDNRDFPQAGGARRHSLEPCGGMPPDERSGRITGSGFCSALVEADAAGHSAALRGLERYIDEALAYDRRLIEASGNQAFLVVWDFLHWNVRGRVVLRRICPATDHSSRSKPSTVFGQSFLSKRDSARSASRRPPVWQVAQ